MFFVSLLLNQGGVVDTRPAGHLEPAGVESTWTRSPATSAGRQSSVEATAPDAPQTGRAFGVGVLLATQNPVDLDYKGLSNAGASFLGRLQTERDKERVLDGLEGAAAGSLAREDANRILSALGERVFLLHNVHDKAPLVFHTRWALSYLRGPLTREQIEASWKAGRRRRSRPCHDDACARRPASKAASQGWARDEPLQHANRPPSIQQYVVPPQGDAGVQPGEVFVPVVLGAARVHFTDAKLKLDTTRDVLFAARVTDDPVPMDWSRSVRLDVDAEDLRHVAPEDGLTFADLPSAAAQPKNYAAWSKSFGRWVGQTERLDVLRHPTLKTASAPGESERDFRIRLQLEGRAARDAAVEGVRRKYAGKQAALAERLRRAEAAVGREQEQASEQRTQTAVSFGATVLGALFGREGRVDGHARTRNHGGARRRPLDEGGGGRQARGRHRRGRSRADSRAR